MFINQLIFVIKFLCNLDHTFCNIKKKVCRQIRELALFYLESTLIVIWITFEHYITHNKPSAYTIYTLLI